MGKRTKNIIIQFSIWSGIGITVFLLLLPVLLPKYAFIRAATVMTMIAVVHYTNSYIVARTLVKGKWNSYLAQALLLLAVLSALRFLLESFVFPRESQPSYFRENSFRPIFFISSIGIVCFISTTVLYLIHLSKKERVLLQTINANNEARLQNLQSQINPHFLFNALNNIYSLVLTGSKQAPEMLLHLTELLRYTVYQKQREKVSVSDEVKQIEFLIELFCLRRDEPYNIRFEKQITNCIIEPMILIPLAENCLKHCDFDLNKNAFARMKLQCDRSQLLFETENTFNTLQQKNETGGVGLQNIRERLQLIYNDNFTFNTVEEENIFHVELCIKWKI